MTTNASTQSEAASLAKNAKAESSAFLVELQPDLDEARHFLDLLGPGQEFTFQTFDDDQERRKKNREERKPDPLAKVFHGSLDQWAESLIEMNRRGAGVFAMVNDGDGVVHAGRDTCRTGDNVRRVRALFVDLDGSPLDPVRECNPHPSIIVESSLGKYHAYWCVNDCALGDFKPRQKQLAERFKGDPSVSDRNRVLRVPGFFHQKGEPFMSRVIFP